METLPNDAALACEHKDFDAFVAVNRITAGEGGAVYTYNVNVRVNCRECGTPLSFEGLPRGVNLQEPVAGAFGIEARLPAHVLCDADKKGETMRIVIPAEAT